MSKCNNIPKSCNNLSLVPRCLKEQLFWLYFPFSGHMAIKKYCTMSVSIFFFMPKFSCIVLHTNNYE